MSSSNQPSRMFIDYLSVEQVYPFELPKIAPITIEKYCSRTGERLATTQPKVKYEGSYSTSITVRVDGCKLIVQGNPSAIDRLDNLFGFQTVEQCVAVYNRILANMRDDEGRAVALPPLTRCTRLDFLQAQASRIKEFRLDDGTVQTVETSHRHTTLGDGMRITRIDLTTNRSVGQGNELDYVSGLSTQRAGYKVGHLYEDGCTVDWQARDQYRKAYVKAVALEKFTLPKARRNFGDDSPEVAYLRELVAYCKAHGVVRMEQELKREYLQREGLCWWGLFDEGRFQAIHEAFLKIDDRLKVTAMDFETIADHLISEGIVDSTKAANTTAMYALQWMTGKAKFDFSKSSVKTHRARLRQIGIDIANPCDASKVRPVVHVSSREVIPVDVLQIPSWYRRPNHLQVAA